MARPIARKTPGAPKRTAADEVPEDSTRSQQRREAQRRPLLTWDEERALRDRIQAGDPEVSRAGVEELVERNLALAMDYAARFMGTRLTVGSLAYDDIYQLACIGLIEAAQRYNGRNRFSTYATWWMRQSVNRGREQTADAIRIPSYLHTSTRKANRAEGTGEPIDDAERERAASVPEQPLSLDIPNHVRRHGGVDAEVTLGDTLADEHASSTMDALEDRLDAIEVLDWIQGHLTETEWFMFARRITMDQDAGLEEIGRGYKRETIRQIELRASRKLRAHGLCPDGAIRPHGPIARAARREIAEVAEKHRVAQRKRQARGWVRKDRREDHGTQALHLSA